MYNPSTLEKIIKSIKNTAVATALAATVACGSGGSPTSPSPNPPNPPINQLNLAIYNATTGQIGTMNLPVNNNTATITYNDINSQFPNSNLNDKHITVRMPRTTQLGQRIQTTNNGTITFNPTQTNYEIYIPNSTNNAPYDCAPEPTLKFGRNVTIGERHENNATGPIEIFTSKITEINQILESRGYGTLTFNPQHPNPAFTVGFTLTSRGGVGYYFPEQKAIYLLGREYSEPNGYRVDFDSNIVKDVPIEEIFETLTYPPYENNLCNRGGVVYLGKAHSTNETQTGVSNMGIDLFTHMYTKAQ